MRVTAHLVKLIVIIGDYEKTSIHLIKNHCTEEAKIQALINECHCSLNGGAEWDEDGKTLYDLYGEMAYRVQDIKPLTLDEYVTIKDTGFF